MFHSELMNSASPSALDGRAAARPERRVDHARHDADPVGGPDTDFNAALEDERADRNSEREDLRRARREQVASHLNNGRPGIDRPGADEDVTPDIRVPWADGDTPGDTPIVSTPMPDVFSGPVEPPVSDPLPSPVDTPRVSTPSPDVFAGPVEPPVSDPLPSPVDGPSVSTPSPEIFAGAPSVAASTGAGQALTPAAGKSTPAFKGAAPGLLTGAPAAMGPAKELANGLGGATPAADAEPLRGLRGEGEAGRPSGLLAGLAGRPAGGPAAFTAAPRSQTAPKIQAQNPSQGGATVTPDVSATARATLAVEPAFAAERLHSTPLHANGPTAAAFTGEDVLIHNGRADADAALEIERAARAEAARPGATAQAQQAAHRLPSTTLPHLAAQISSRFNAGQRVFEIRMDPPEMGRVDVKLELGADQRVQAVLTVERPDTLQDLQRAARELERALAEAGLELGENGLSFELGGGQEDDGDAPGASGDRSFDVFADNETAGADALPLASHDAYGFALSARTGVNISV